MVTFFGVQRDVAKQCARPQMDAVHWTMHHHATLSPCSTLFLVQRPEPPRQFQPRQICSETFSTPFEEGGYIHQPVLGHWGFMNGPNDVTTLRHHQPFVLPSLSVFQPEDNACRMLGGQNLAVNANIRLGGQQIFPLFCNGPYPKMKVLCSFECIQWVEIGRIATIEEQRVSHVTNI